MGRSSGRLLLCGRRGSLKAPEDEKVALLGGSPRPENRRENVASVSTSERTLRVVVLSLLVTGRKRLSPPPF